MIIFFLYLPRYPEDGYRRIIEESGDFFKYKKLKTEKNSY